MRLFSVVYSSLLSGAMLQIAGYIALLPVLGWLFIMFIRRRDTGPEVFGAQIWWQHLRVYHALLWACFAYLAIRGNRFAYVPLLIDTLFGLSAFIHNRIRGGELFEMEILEKGTSCRQLI